MQIFYFFIYNHRSPFRAAYNIPTIFRKHSTSKVDRTKPLPVVNQKIVPSKRHLTDSEVPMHSDHPNVSLADNGSSTPAGEIHSVLSHTFLASDSYVTPSPCDCIPCLNRYRMALSIPHLGRLSHHAGFLPHLRALRQNQTHSWLRHRRGVFHHVADGVDGVADGVDGRCGKNRLQSYRP